MVLSLQKGDSRSRTRYPPQIRCQRALIQWLGSFNSDNDRLDKGRGSSPKGAGAFSVHFCAYKSGPVGDKTALRAASGSFGSPRAPGLKSAPLRSRPPGDGRISPASADCIRPAGARLRLRGRTPREFSHFSSSSTGQWSLPYTSERMSAAATRSVSRWETIK